MTSGAYQYPDGDDRVTSSFVQQNEPYEGYWGASDQRALTRVAARLAELLGDRSAIHALDAGCGDGRLLPWISTLAAEITATDPDSERLGRAKNVALPAGTGITFEAAAIGEISGAFELVVCSHVVQHVPTANVEPILRALHEATAPGGALLLSFSRSPVGAGRYTLDWIDGGRVRSEEVAQDRFDRALTADKDPAVLPVRHIDPDELRAVAESIGWSTELTWTYHVLDDLGVLDQHLDRDELVNQTPELRRALGRDIMIVFRKKGS